MSNSFVMRVKLYRAMRFVVMFTYGVAYALSSIA